MRPTAIAALVLLTVSRCLAQDKPASSATTAVASSALILRESSRKNLVSEMGGAFMGSPKCDGEGNLYIRKFAADRPLLGPVVEIDGDGKRSALFDPVAFSALALDRADAFSPAGDGSLYQIAQSGDLKPRIYVLHFSPDGSASSSVRLEAGFEVYSFAAFWNGNLLISGFERNLEDARDKGRSVTEVFSADGRRLADVSFDPPVVSPAKGKPGPGAAPEPERSAPSLALAEAEVGEDGNLYAMHNSSPALIYVISPSGKVVRTIKVASPIAHAGPGTFHLSRNRLAVLFGNDDRRVLAVSDAETGRPIAAYLDPGTLGSAFACYSADEGVFTFLNLGEGNTIEVIRAEAR
jgi:hypothetical protein